MTTQTLKNWNTMALGKIADITSSKRIFASDYVSQGVPFYRSREIIEKQEGNDISTKLYISKEKYESIKNKFGVPKQNDILITSVGTLGIPYVVKASEVFYFKDGNLIWIRNLDQEQVIPKFIYYLILNPETQQRLKGISIGSSQGAFTISAIKDFKIGLPPLSTQKLIADVLSTYDDLIENNTRRIQILEQIAQATYTEWFVNFRFPGHEKVKMIDSGTDFGKIPEGWEIKKIKDFGSVITGKTPSKSDPSNFGSDIPFIKTPDLHGKIFCIETSESLSVKGANTQKNKTLPPKTLVVSCIGTLGVVGITSSEAQTNQQINAVILADQKYLEYLYFVLVNLKQEL